MAQINWFPGHMKKTLEKIQAILQLIDIAIILVDARAPQATTNPELIKLLHQKPRLFLLNKADLADQTTTSEWLKFYQAQSIPAIAINATSFKSASLIAQINQLLEAKQKRQVAKGMVNRPIRAAIIGIPNVGKSTLINSLAKKRVMVVENRAGVTKALKWIKLANNLELLDTPGILWPKFSDQTVANKIAMLGGIKASILPLDLLAVEIVKFMTKHHLKKFNDFFKININQPTDDAAVYEVLTTIARQRGLILKANKINQPAVELLVVREFQNGSFGPLSLETPK